MILTDFCSVAESFLWSDETHLAVVLTSHEDHALRLDTTNLAWCEVGKDTDLLAYHLLWRVLLGDTRHDHALVDAGVDSQLEKLICLRHALSLENCSRADVHLSEIIECALLLLRSHYRCLCRLCSCLTLCANSLKTSDLSIYNLILDLAEEESCRVELMACRKERCIAEVFHESERPSNATPV